MIIWHGWMKFRSSWWYNGHGGVLPFRQLWWLFVTPGSRCGCGWKWIWAKSWFECHHCSTCSPSFMSIHCELCTKCRMRGTRGPFSTNFLRCADLQNFSFSPEAAKALACMGLHGACHALQLANCLEDDYGLAQAALDLWQTLDNWVMKRRRQITWKTCVPTGTLEIWLSNGTASPTIQRWNLMTVEESVTYCRCFVSKKLNANGRSVSNSLQYIRVLFMII